MATITKSVGGDLILLEMMFVPERIEIAMSAALAKGLRVWAGFSARRSDDGRLLSYWQMMTCRSTTSRGWQVDSGSVRRA